MVPTNDSSFSCMKLTSRWKSCTFPPTHEGWGAVNERIYSFRKRLRSWKPCVIHYAWRWSGWWARSRRAQIPLGEELSVQSSNRNSSAACVSAMELRMPCVLSLAFAKSATPEGRGVCDNAVVGPLPPASSAHAIAEVQRHLSRMADRPKSTVESFLFSIMTPHFHFSTKLLHFSTPASETLLYNLIWLEDPSSKAYTRRWEIINRCRCCQSCF